MVSLRPETFISIGRRRTATATTRLPCTIGNWKLHGKAAGASLASAFLPLELRGALSFFRTDAENQRRRDAATRFRDNSHAPIRDSQQNRDAALRKSPKRTRTCHTRCPVPPFQLGDAVGVTGGDRDVRPSEAQGFGLPSSSSSKVRSSSALDLPRPY